MAKYTLEVAQDYRQSVEAVFAKLSDHNQLGKVLGIPVKRVVSGAGDINGVGSVRRMGLWPAAIEETVTAMVPNQSIDYRISKGGAPLKNHSGGLTFSKTGQGSRVVWTITFDSSVPVVGAVIKQVLTQGLRLGLKRIK
jgi:hypothetical protein